MTSVTPPPVTTDRAGSGAGPELAERGGDELPRSFWADALRRTVARRSAAAALAWIGLVAFLAVFAPFIANGHPLLLWRRGADGAINLSSPLLDHLTAVDLLLVFGALVAAPWLLARASTPRPARLAILLAAAAQAGVTLMVAHFVGEGNLPLRSGALFLRVAASALAVALPFLLVIPVSGWGRRGLLAALVALVAALAQWWGGSPRLTSFDVYAQGEAAGEMEAVYTLIPWSPQQRETEFYLLPPMTRVAAALPSAEGTAYGDRVFLLGTDNTGQDVLSQLIHACRLSISIGLVSTGIAVVIGVTLGALMGYFGGWLDLLLYRVVEIFMAIPVLFLLIVAAAVLPRNTYVMMAIIGCVAWTGAARFTRAEFYRLRSQDFVQAANALGLPLRSVLFRHMLPNGVTPVLVDASFAIAAAILAEATLSFLGLGPEGQASWGRLLSSATGAVGEVLWWLAIFPGAAIFLTVLAYNLVGESLRDAIDPKLRKAAP